MVLLYNDVSHWLDVSLESALILLNHPYGVVYSISTTFRQVSDDTRIFTGAMISQRFSPISFYIDKLLIRDINDDEYSNIAQKSIKTFGQNELLRLFCCTLRQIARSRKIAWCVVSQPQNRTEVCLYPARNALEYIPPYWLNQSKWAILKIIFCKQQRLGSVRAQGGHFLPWFQMG